MAWGRRTNQLDGGDEPRAPRQPARRYALFLLGQREWAEKELRARLALKGYDEAAIEDGVAFCKQHGLQSDQRYTASRVRTRASSRGNRSLQEELQRQGIESDAIAAALSAAPSEDVRAIEAVRRFESKPLDLKTKAKVWRLLASRGFSGEAIATAISHLRATSPTGDTSSDRDD